MAYFLDEHGAERCLQIVRKHAKPLSCLWVLERYSFDSICKTLVAKTVKGNNVPVCVHHNVAKQMAADRAAGSSD
jgi:hypothetical protein